MMVLQTFSGVADKTILRVGLYSWCSFRGQHIYYKVIGETQSNGCLSRTWGLHLKNQMEVFDISKTYLRSLVFVDRLSYSLHWMLHLGPHHSWQWIRSLSLVQAFSNGSPWSKSGPHTILCLTPGLALCQLKNTYGVSQKERAPLEIKYQKKMRQDFCLMSTRYLGPRIRPYSVKTAWQLFYSNSRYAY